MTKIEELTQSYKQQINQIQERRENWNNEKLQFAFDQLANFRDNIDLEWLVDIDDSQNNRTTVYLYFPARPSGISLDTGNGFRHFAREGGYLSYSQSTDGQIVVWISYPYVKEIEPQPHNKFVELVDPEEITENKIQNHVEIFLREITDSESEDKQTIGFNTEGFER